MDIVFTRSLYATTHTPDNISFENAMEEYSPFGEEQTTTVDHNTGDVLRATRLYVSSAPASFKLDNVINLGSFSRAQMTTTFELNKETLIADVQLGQTEDALHSVHVRITGTKTAQTAGGIVTLIYKGYLVYENVTGLDVEVLLMSYNAQYPGDGQYTYSRLGFGMGFIHLPDREEGPENDLVIFFGSASGTPSAINNYIFPRVTGDYFNIDSNQVNSAGSGNIGEIRIIGTFDLAQLSELDMYFSYNETSSEAGEPSEPGGYNPGSSGFDDSSDTIAIPDTPTAGVSNVGFVNVYKTDLNDLQGMGEELFPPLNYSSPTPITGNDVPTALVNGFNAFITFFANIPSFFQQITASTLINYIIDCHVIPVTPSTGSPTAIKVGPKTLTINGNIVTSDYVDVDCGDISLSEYYANFADFLTSFKLFLPFVGFVPAKPEWFYRESLNVTYRFNVIDGSFVAFVRSTGAYVNNHNTGQTILGQYGGNACIHIPITGVTYASMVSGLIGAGAGMTAGVASGNIPALATSAISAFGQHGDIAQSNAYSSSVAFLGSRRPFVLIERPVSNFSKTYSKESGIPSNISRQLGSVAGFSIIGDVHLDGITATDAEKAEIERLLHEGVIL